MLRNATLAIIAAIVLSPMVAEAKKFKRVPNNVEIHVTASAKGKGPSQAAAGAASGVSPKTTATEGVTPDTGIWKAPTPNGRRMRNGKLLRKRN